MMILVLKRVCRLKESSIHKGIGSEGDIWAAVFIERGINDEFNMCA